MGLKWLTPFRIHTWLARGPALKRKI